MDELEKAIQFIDQAQDQMRASDGSGSDAIKEAIELLEQARDRVNEAIGELET